MLPSGLPEEVAAGEDIARFLTQSSHLNASAVKPAAFLPSQQDETSVSRHGAEPLESLRELGLQAAGDRTLHGAAILKASAIRDAELDVLAAEPPDRHAVILGWPSDRDPDIEKARRKQLALLLASAAGQPLRLR